MPQLEGLKPTAMHPHDWFWYDTECAVPISIERGEFETSEDFVKSNPCSGKGLNARSCDEKYDPYVERANDLCADIQTEKRVASCYCPDPPRGKDWPPTHKGWEHNRPTVHRPTAGSALEWVSTNTGCLHRSDFV